MNKTRTDPCPGGARILSGETDLTQQISKLREEEKRIENLACRGGEQLRCQEAMKVSFTEEVKFHGGGHKGGESESQGIAAPRALYAGGCWEQSPSAPDGSLSYPWSFS